MGRSYTSGFDGTDQAVTVLAGEDIVQGNLVKLNVGGYAFKVLDTQLLATQNNSAPVAVQASYAPEGVNYGDSGSNYVGQNTVALPGGGFAHGYGGNGGSVSSNANVGFFSGLGVLMFKVVLATNGGSQGFKVTRAGADNVAVVWGESSTLFMAVVNYTTGAIVATAANIGSFSQSMNYDLIRLASGEVVVAYVAGTDMVFKRFNAFGGLQGALVTVDAASAPTMVVALPLAAGGFIIRYARTTVGLRMARFNAAGVLQGALVSITTGANLFEGYQTSATLMGALRGKTIECSNGNIITSNPAVATQISFKVYDASLALLSTVTLSAAVTANYSESVQLAAKAGGGFWMAFAASSGPTVFEYTNTGVQLKISQVSSALNIWRLIDRQGNGPIAIQGVNVGSSSSSINLLSYKADLASLEGAPTNLYTNGSSTLQTHWSEVLSNGYLVSVSLGGGTTSEAMTVVAHTSTSVLGVAQTTAATGASVKVATAGKFVITQNLTSPAFDRRTSTPPGTKGSTVGNLAVLSGLNG